MRSGRATRALTALAALLLAALAADPGPACARLPGWHRAAPPALRERGAERQLWLAWRTPRDRAAAALLLRAVAQHPRCRSLRCRLALCPAPRGLCALLAADPLHRAYVAGFQPLAQASCPGARHTSAVGERELSSGDDGAALMVAEDVPLLMHAPWLRDMLKRFDPSPRALAAQLAREAAAGGAGPGEAALAAAAAAPEEELAPPAPEKPTRYYALVYVCEEDEWGGRLRALLSGLAAPIVADTRPLGVEVALEPRAVRCASETALPSALAAERAAPGAHRLLGAVAAGAGVAAAARQARQLALVAYDPQADAGPALLAGPRAAELADALVAALRGCGWARAALLSQRSALAAAVAERVAAAAAGPLRLAALPAEEPALRATLRSLLAERPRVVVLNADGEGAARALRLAAEEGLAEQCAWLAREWSAGAAPLPLLALRAAPRSAAEAGARGAADARGALAALERAWGGARWAARAAPLAEALLTLTGGFARLFSTHEQLRFDHVAEDAPRYLREFLRGTGGAGGALRGVARDLRFDELGARPPRVRLELWPRGARAGRALPPAALPAGCPAARAAPVCSLPVGGDTYQPAACLDLAAALGAPALLLGALAAGPAAAALRRRRARARAGRRLRLRAEAAAALLARQPRAGPELRALLVARERLTLLRALGSGRHGRVWLARLAPEGRLVAAKGPLAGAAPAEEGELLREADALAPLRHEHVLRLLGVCVGPGPPLLLSAPAPHGDLLSYLRARRPPGDAAEAAHVAAPALTRLAREAALALAYLAGRGLVHRDVRAANCLLDARRSLLLADFGMARRLGSRGPSAESEGSYACRRRALFPVLWMAPESLARGVFSPASDVWSLGVLVLELVSLGARPFGSLGAAAASALVVRGGHARLPAGAAADTRRLARLCWRREARARPSAAEVAAWLAARPLALQPCPPAPDADSGLDDKDGS